MLFPRFIATAYRMCVWRPKQLQYSMFCLYMTWHGWMTHPVLLISDTPLFFLSVCLYFFLTLGNCQSKYGMVECRDEVLESRSFKIQGKRRQMVQMGCDLRGCENAWCFVLDVSQYEFSRRREAQGSLQCSLLMFQHKNKRSWFP